LPNPKPQYAKNTGSSKSLNILNKENGNDDFDIIELELEMVHTLDLSKE
jgi:hypothetical protein